jgi:hypothetical protein
MTQTQSLTGEAKGILRETAIVCQPASQSLHAIAREMLESHNGDPTQARLAMQEALADPGLRRAIAEDAIAIAVREKLSSVRTYERGAIFRDAKRDAEGIARRANAIDRAFMDFPLPFGGKLADATKADIHKAADHYEVSAATQQRRAAWLRAIANMMPDNVHVSAALTEAQLANAWSGQ